ncbi:MAG: hypothetical protein EP346_11850 [Bacteroidetes bacterium]|nr:MAG: hypothetical protein EP346_11850 [Bacteroidota bacterium]
MDALISMEECMSGAPEGGAPRVAADPQSVYNRAHNDPRTAHQFTAKIEFNMRIYMVMSFKEVKRLGNGTSTLTIMLMNISKLSSMSFRVLITLLLCSSSCSIQQNHKQFICKPCVTNEGYCIRRIEWEEGYSIIFAQSDSGWVQVIDNQKLLDPDSNYLKCGLNYFMEIERVIPEKIMNQNGELVRNPSYPTLRCWVSLDPPAEVCPDNDSIITLYLLMSLPVEI